MPKTSAYHPTFLFNRARDFFWGAEELFKSPDRKTQLDRWYPTYFLYAHAAEMALKAYCRSQSPDVEYGHELIILYDRCQQLGFAVGGSEDIQIRDLLQKLDDANQDQGLRYFMDVKIMWDLAWTRRVVGHLIEVIAPHVERAEQDHPSGTGKVTGLMIVLGKTPRQES